MIPFQAMVAAEHLAELRREAAANRLAREAREAARGTIGRSGAGLPRRALARLAFALSRATAATARRLDPADDVLPRYDAFAPRRASGATGR